MTTFELLMGRGGAKKGKKCAQIGLQLEWMEKNEKKLHVRSVFLSWLAGLSMKFGVQGHMDHIGYIGPGGGGQKKPNKGPRNASNGRA